MGGIFHGCVCRGQYCLVYHQVLSSVDSYGWYILVGISTAFVCLSWTIMVGISSSFVCRGQYWLAYYPFVLNVFTPLKEIYHWTILGGIFHGCVCRGQYWLVYHPVLSSMDSYGWYILVGISTAFVCLSWTIMVGISSSFVGRGQYWLV